MIKNFLLSYAFILVFSIATVSDAATLTLGGGSYTVGQTITVPLLVSTLDGESMNAVGVTLSFPANMLRVVSVGSSGVIDLWAQKPSFSNTNGTINLQGVVYNPGFSGTNGRIVLITFKALASGSAPITFSTGSVLANDGQGSEILSASHGTTLSIQDAAPVEKVVPVKQAIVPATSTIATQSTPVATSSDMQAATSAPITLFDVSAQPGNLAPQQASSSFLISYDSIYILLLCFVALCIAFLIILGAWYIWHRMHKTRRRLLQHIASTDTAIHVELLELINALNEEVTRLETEKSKRDLTMEEKRILMKFSHLTEKAQRIMGARSFKKVTPREL
jgi:hypothetical protein